MAQKRTYFISDLHLGASYIADTHAHQRRVVAFLQSIEHDADTLYLLGDILDYWFEYRNVVPRGYVRFFGQLARMADMGIKIVWFTGNHDIWLFDYIRDEIGVEIVDTNNDGVIRQIGSHKFFLSHGDNFGHQPLSFRILRRFFRCRFCQKLYSGIHPRWTIPFAHGWSSHSRKQSGNYEVFGENARLKVVAAAEQKLADQPDIDYFIIGHHHAAVDMPIKDKSRLIVLGNWINRSDYAVYDGNELTLKSFDVK